jgi:hypothetical protein
MFKMVNRSIQFTAKTDIKSFIPDPMTGVPNNRQTRYALKMAGNQINL